METKIIEIWKDIPNYEGKYQIFNYGNVKSLHSRNKIIRKSFKCKKGYHRVMLKRGVSFAIHRLVASAFIANPDNKPEVNHLDSNRSNNLVSNLEWVTHSENQIHAYRYGKRTHCGDNHPQKKLTSEIVLNIRKLYLSGVGPKQLSDNYSVGVSCIWNIIKYRTWKNLP